MKKIESTGMVLNIDNIDTDQIIPAKFLKATNRDGFGKHLFANWRYNEDNSEKSDFALNNYKKGSAVLIAGNNFGCGSSREHAAWAISDFGIRTIISTQFADIFKGNALNNDIVPIEVNQSELDLIMNQVNANKETKIEVDIEEQTLEVIGDGFSFKREFEIDQLKKKFIMADISDLEYLISIKNDVANYEELNVL